MTRPPITPEEARSWLYALDERKPSLDVVEAALAVVAGMRVAYDYEVWEGTRWVPMGYSFANKEDAREWLKMRYRDNPARVVTRYVYEVREGEQ